MKDYFGYENKVCVVTGAASGMGKATAEMLVDLNANVYALDWNEVEVAGIKEYIQVDLSNKESIDGAFDKIPEHIDSFFGIAGLSGAKTDFLTTTKVDLIANKYICEAYLENRMSKGGSIAFMTSTGGNNWEDEGNKSVYMPVLEVQGWDETVEALEKTGLTALPGTLGYPFSKLAMNYYTMQLQQVFAAKGIRVNSVLPGPTATGMKDEFEKMAGGEESLISNNGYNTSLATSQDMAAPIVFLNSAMAANISGVDLVVDYGKTGEEIAGIREVQPMNLSAILQMMRR
ncbi:MAG: SDR family oxidoreductase [Erysipelotrichaceae bacterium]|nr:SDR family oxidoreductase [Erysipelotrichaceae bacterium]